ncbi:MAG: hypothetical protein GY749_34155 [Desulfobacteraceae bacterium]|nr:hypothetical protein [Desulfobacteraceae bacterium]
MNNEILVKEFRKIEKILEQEHGHVVLFMLKAFDTDILLWNVIVSTPEYDKMTTKKALKHLISILRSNLGKDILRKILRLTVLKTNDPFVEEMNRVFKVKDFEKYIRPSVISGIYLENAIVFESDPVLYDVNTGHKKIFKKDRSNKVTKMKTI